MTKRNEFEGFGAPKEFGAAHFRVEIPRGTERSVLIFEDFGLTEDAPAAIERASLPKTLWNKIAKDLAADFNPRLKARKLPTGSWTAGSVKVERILGKELCILAWAIESLPNRSKEIGQAVAHWKKLRPEERWWLFTMTAADGGRSDESQSRWRAALRAALGDSYPKDNKVIVQRMPVRRKKRRAADNLEFSFS